MEIRVRHSRGDRCIYVEIDHNGVKFDGDLMSAKEAAVFADDLSRWSGELMAAASEIIENISDHGGY